LQALAQKIMPYLKLMRLDKPIGILLLLWPTLSALWIAAEGVPDIKVLIVFVLGVIVMRSAGCVINDYADQNIDGLVLRTRGRPIVSGEVTAKQALMLFAGLSLFAFALVLLLNTMTILLSVVALLLAASYPFMKRYTYLPQIFLGAAFGWAIPMAFAAQSQTLPPVAWLLFLANILWATAYDTFYAMADREDDLLAGIKSTAILFGDDDRLIIGILQLSFLLVMLLIGAQMEMGFVYYLGVVIAMFLFAYQHYLVKERQPAQCLLAFLNNNWVGAAVFVGIAVHYGLT